MWSRRSIWLLLPVLAGLLLVTGCRQVQDYADTVGGFAPRAALVACSANVATATQGVSAGFSVGDSQMVQAAVSSLLTSTQAAVEELSGTEPDRANRIRKALTALQASLPTSPADLATSQPAVMSALSRLGDACEAAGTTAP